MDAGKLGKLSKKQKLELYDALKAKRDMQTRKPSAYQPNAGQTPVHQSKAKVRAVFSGNGSGKTAMTVQEILWAAEGYNPMLNEYTQVPARVAVVLDRPEKVEQVYLPELKKWRTFKPEQFHKKGKPYYSHITFDNGSEIIFLFHEMEPMAVESLEIDFAALDEPAPRHIYVGLRRGGRKKHTQARYLLVGTPIAGSWMRTDIYEPWTRGELPDHECFRFGTVVNETNLASGYIADFSRILTEKEKQVRLEGAFHDLDGLGLAHLFKRDTHVVQAAGFRWPANWPTIVVIDTAMAKAHVAVMLGTTPDDQLVVLKEMALKGTAPQFAPAFIKWVGGHRVVDVIADSLGSSDLSGGDGALSFITSLNNHMKQLGSHLRCRATSYAEKSDEAWISMIREVLVVPEEANNYGKREPRLKVLSTCIGVISDIETVAWERHRTEDILKPKLDMKKKDYLSCVKYALATQPSHKKGSERVIRGRVKAGLRNTDRTFKKA